ncbi:MAG: hypothetical protein QGG72_06875 [Verrucomicrobiota bacterium]|nr:hypothetical protein [Verrucomicrobiota bacterium]
MAVFNPLMIRSASFREQSGVKRMIPVALRCVIIGAARTRGSVNWQKMAMRLPLFDAVKLSSTAVPWRLN